MQLGMSALCQKRTSLAETDARSGQQSIVLRQRVLYGSSANAPKAKSSTTIERKLPVRLDSLGRCEDLGRLNGNQPAHWSHIGQLLAEWVLAGEAIRRRV